MRGVGGRNGREAGRRDSPDQLDLVAGRPPGLLLITRLRRLPPRLARPKLARAGLARTRLARAGLARTRLVRYSAQFGESFGCVPFEDQFGPGQLDRRVTEQPPAEPGRQREWRIGHNEERPPWQRNAPQVGLNHAHQGIRIGKPPSKLPGQRRIDLDRDDFGAGCRQRPSQRAKTRAKIKDKVAPANPAGPDELAYDATISEIVPAVRIRRWLAREPLALTSLPMPGDLTLAARTRLRPVRATVPPCHGPP